MRRRQYPGVYAYEADGSTLYRATFRDSAGRQRQKRGFSSPTAAAKYRAKMMERADRGELRTTRQRFDEWFDEWLRVEVPIPRPLHRPDVAHWICVELVDQLSRLPRPRNSAAQLLAHTPSRSRVASMSAHGGEELVTH